MLLTGRIRALFLIAASAAAAFGMFICVTMYISDRYVARAGYLLDDPVTEEMDARDLSEETATSYQEAIGDLTRSIRLSPLDAAYRAALAGLYSQMSIWAETMLLMKGSAPDELQAHGDGARAAADQAMKEALSLDPSNVDLHLLHGQHLMAQDEREKARLQMLKAAQIYPKNSQTRFTVAMALLSMGYREDAREQARILAKDDDSYRLDDDDPMTTIVREQRTDAYERRLTRSYLYRALEIVRRSAPGDRRALDAIVPENTDARETARLFSLNHGLDVN